MKAEATEIYEPVVRSIRRKVVNGVRENTIKRLMFPNADEKIMRGCVCFVEDAVFRLGLKESLTDDDRDLVAPLLYEWIAMTDAGGLGTFYEAAAGIYKPYSDAVCEGGSND